MSFRPKPEAATISEQPAAHLQRIQVLAVHNAGNRAIV
jgi:hypothetical protein